MKRLPLILLSLLCLSCSTTRVLSEGQFRLASNEVILEPKEELSASSLMPYIRQQANSYWLFGWNPFLNIYNWSKNPNSLWQRIGVAPVVFNPDLVNASADNILTRLEYLGYYDASVTASVVQKARLAQVSYKVDLGHRQRIDSLVFEVPEGEFAEDFAADQANISIKEGDYLSEKALEAETLRGSSYFRSKGYYDFNKNNYFFEADTLAGKSILYYRIKGYTRNETAENDAPISKFHVGEVTIQHPTDIRLRPDLLRKLNTITPGALYSEELMNSAYYRFSALNLFNSVVVEVDPRDDATLDCNLKLNGSDVLGFKLNAEVSTNSSGLLGASPQISFYHKNLFHGGERLNVSLSGNWQFVPGSIIASSEFSASASLSLPSISERNKSSRFIPRNDIKASYNYQDRPEYVRSVASLSYGYSGQIAQNFFYQFYPLQFSLVNQADLSDDFSYTLLGNPYLWDTFMDQLDLGASMMLYHTTDSSIVPKGEYGFTRLSLDLSGNLVSLFNQYLPFYPDSNRRTLLGLPYNQYARAELSVAKVFRFGKQDRSALAMRFIAGLGVPYGNSGALPFEKQFYAGGASSMRGWQVRTLGPGFDPRDAWSIIPSQTGDMKLEADLEFRFPLVWKLEAALFAEAGNVWVLEDIKGQLLDSIAADWGLGLRVNLDFILLRLDAGFRLHDPARESGSRWLKPVEWFSRNGAALHFGVGYPF